MPKHSSSKKSSSAGSYWSEAQFSQEYQRWYFDLLDRHGNPIERKWDETPQISEQDVPRGHGGMEQLTDRLASTSISDSQAHAYHPGSQYPQDTRDVIDATHDPPSPDYTHKAKSSSKGKGKSSDKQSAYAPYGQDPRTQQMQNQYVDAYGQPQPNQYHGTTASQDPYQQNPYQQDPYGQGVDGVDDIQAALDQSRRDMYGTDLPGESSASAAYQSYQPAYDDEPYEEATYPSYGQDTPRAGSPVDPMQIYSNVSMLHGSSQAQEQMMAAGVENYRVEHSTRFQPGEVFKILWSEPRGAQQVDERITERKPFDNGDFYIGIRRFIVIATDEGHSTCVPILTYEKKGCTKKGVRPNKHGIIYERGGKPRLVNKEGPLGYDPVAVKLHVEDEKLAKESRVNYSKLVTIEHNTKVYFIGSIVGKDLEHVHDAVDECWSAKKQKRVKKSHHHRK